MKQLIFASLILLSVSTMYGSQENVNVLTDSGFVKHFDNDCKKIGKVLNNPLVNRCKDFVDGFKDFVDGFKDFAEEVKISFVDIYSDKSLNKDPIGDDIKKTFCSLYKFGKDTSNAACDFVKEMYAFEPLTGGSNPDWFDAFMESMD